MPLPLRCQRADIRAIRLLIATPFTPWLTIADYFHLFYIHMDYDAAADAAADTAVISLRLYCHMLFG